MTKAQTTSRRSPRERRPVDGATGWATRLDGSNINPQTLLATDYLNHFNEAIMILDLAAEIPDCLEDIIDWAPKSYVEHFTHSHFPHKELAVEAYANAPAARRQALEEVVDDLNLLILCTIAEATVGAAIDSPEKVQQTVSSAAAQLRHLIAAASGVINGAPIGPGTDAARKNAPTSGMSQDAVDSLFD